MQTILHYLAAWADTDPNSIAQSYKSGGKWKTISAREYCDRVYWMALFLESKGFTKQDILAIFSFNCPEWVHVDLAALLMGAKAAGIYPNSAPKDVNYVLSHTEARFLAVQNKEYFNRITESSAAGLPSNIELVIVFDGDTSISSKAVSYVDAIAQGKKLAAAKDARSIADYLKALDPSAGAFMIYTSGTTGNPKAAVLSHDNLVFAITIGAKYWKLKPGQGDSIFSFLPLCHVAETLQNFGAGIYLRCNVNFASKFENVSTELPEVQPTILLCVPRLWEKMMEGVITKLDRAEGPKKLLARWAMGIGAKYSDTLLFRKKDLSLLDQIQLKAADKLILSKVREALGLKRAKIMVSGAAPLPVHVCKWFRSLGLELVEVLGQTETTALICMTSRGMDCSGTVGKPVPGLEVKIAEDGEILTRGRHVFLGYFKDEAATQKVLEGGWLHTGDLGEIDKRGLMKIKGRKKEILKTSGGKMVAPLPIEEALKASPIISQVCMVGDGRKFLSALITLTETKLSDLSKVNGTLKNTVITSPAVIEEVKKYVDQINSSLASHEQIKRFAVLSKEFSIDTGEMTPTLKMKRNVIETRYKDVIEMFYEIV